MSATDFQSLLDQPLDSFKKPKPIPEGEYIFGIKEFELGKSAQKQTPKVTFECVPTESLPSVDEQLLAAYLDGNPLGNKTVKSDFFITGEAAWRLSQFLKEHVGIPEGTSLKDALPLTKGQKFIGTIKHEINPQNGDVFAKITSTAALPQ